MVVTRLKPPVATIFGYRGFLDGRTIGETRSPDEGCLFFSLSSLLVIKADYSCFSVPTGLCS
jgi:hypothetical protein